MSNLSKKLISLFMLASLLFAGGIFYSSASPAVYAAVDPGKTACEGIKAAGGNCDDTSGLSSTVKGIINVLLYVVGVAAVIMMIVGAIRFVTSAGNQQSAAVARQTILYSLIGIIIAVSSYVIVNYVFGEVSNPTSSTDTSLPKDTTPPTDLTAPVIN